MKRLLMLLFLGGLFLNTQAVTITVVHFTGETKKVSPVGSIEFLPYQNIQIHLSNGTSTKLSGVRTITFKDNAFTAVEDVVVQPSISVYPNPTADMLIVEGVSSKEEIAIYSVNGTKVLSTQSQEGTNTINVSGLPNGVYFLKHSTETFKLIKE